ncbi:MAG TPA: 1,4-alpha-glucan branching protein GlgB, partial [Methanoregulaceae archaeon]|nr:1,4-alpha-glucan branching protein GlgB [Methanoregulaceae archaeon]
FIPGIGTGERYKYRVVSWFGGYVSDRADPFAFATELPPGTASRVADPVHLWQDGEWLAERAKRQRRDAPISIYEVHAGSWRRDPADPCRLLSWPELAGPLVDHVTDLDFTHVELLPVMEHPFYASWGYQGLGYFAPSARYGTPEELMGFIDTLHRAGIGVILDWVPSHFPVDGHGLAFFDGTHLFEHAHPLQRLHPEWGSAVFNLGRNEVRSFLASSGLFWLDRYHADGLRVDAVASMLYLDYGRRPGEWIPNVHGGRENLDAVSFLRFFNESAHARHPGVLICAEESTAWPLVTRPPSVGGLGFSLKWNMGWMHDTLRYLSRDPVHRKYHHDEFTFAILYAWSEDYILPLSHDEVVHMKGSLLGRMPGDDWQRRANLRLLLGHQFTHPGKKLLFMGGEFGQEAEWSHDRSLDWHLIGDERHRGLMRFTRDAARLYRG